MKKYFTTDTFMQTWLIVFSGAGFLLVSMKLSQYGVIMSLIAQIFWIYSSHKAWKKAGQISIFINAIAMTFVFGYGVLNYWVL